METTERVSPGATNAILFCVLEIRVALWRPEKHRCSIKMEGLRSQQVARCSPGLAPRRQNPASAQKNVAGTVQSACDQAPETDI